MADDDEQLEAIKSWWNENGTSLVVTLVVVVAGIFGYQAWENQQEASADQASVIYEDLVSAIVKESPLQALSEDTFLQVGSWLAGFRMSTVDPGMLNWQPFCLPNCP